MNTFVGKILSENTRRELLLYLGSFAFFISCAKAQIYIPFTPIPITLHTFAVAVMGCLLPLRASLFCMGVYLIDGFFGAPCFGVHLSSLAIGYYMGMVLAIYFLNLATKHSSMGLLMRLAIASLMIWFFGVFYLQFHMGLAKALTVGVLPFIPGNLFKLFLAYLFIKFVSKYASQLLDFSK